MNVLITGGSLGIGHAIARELHQNGHELFLVSRDSERLHAAVSGFSERIGGFKAELGKPEQIDALIKKTENARIMGKKGNVIDLEVNFDAGTSLYSNKTVIIYLQ